MGKAWKVTAQGVSSITNAETRAKAKHRCRKSAKEAGYDVKYKDVHAVRAPQYDEVIDHFTARCVLSSSLDTVLKEMEKHDEQGQ